VGKNPLLIGIGMYVIHVAIEYAQIVLEIIKDLMALAINVANVVLGK
jgi:hypothetical protein